MTEQIQVQKITSNMTLGEVIKKFPSSVEIIQDFGLTCVGCSVAYWESLEGAAKGHGLSDEKLKEMIDKLNTAAEDIDGNAPVNVTQKAADKVLELLKQKQKEDYALRVGIKEGGCSGFEYTIVLDNEQNDDDKVIKQRGVKIFIDKKSLEFMQGSLIDYVDALQGAGFKISNPNAKSSCGCGQSFN
jgi:iron-sulfur cluster assembly protein